MIEGITKAKANDMTIQETIDLCRKTARSDVVKSVLSASKFDTPGDALRNSLLKMTSLVVKLVRQQQTRIFRTTIPTITGVVSIITTGVENFSETVRTISVIGKIMRTTTITIIISEILMVAKTTTKILD